MNKVETRKNIIIIITVLCFFSLFLFSWITNGGVTSYGLYSEIDGQGFAWTSKFLVEWGRKLDINTLNPFQGMGSVFLPVNPWWNPGALVMDLPTSHLTNSLISYAIYWAEIFIAIYFLAKTTGLNKIESILASEIFVLYLFPPFSAYFNTIPYFSLAPIYAHLFAIISIITISFVKLGEGSTRRNIFLVFLLIFMTYVIAMVGGFGIIPCFPIYALFVLGFALQKRNRRQLLWQMLTISLIICLFLVTHAYHYYKDTLGYVSASVGTSKKIAFSIPTVWREHTSIFYGSPPLFSYLHVFALLGALVGIFCQRGKYRWIACSFVFIVLMPDTLNFLFANGIVSGSISQINFAYYLWSAYPLYGIFAVILMSFLWHLMAQIMSFAVNKIAKGSSKINSVFHSFSINYLILLAPFILPALAFYIWFGNFSKSSEHVKEPSRTPIVNYLETQIGLKPGDIFRGTTISYFASKDAPLRQAIIHVIESPYDVDPRFSMSHYILSREFLNRRFNNRHMFSDLWNFNIPTLEEYTPWISLPMYVFFGKMLAEKRDILERHFLNVYKLDLKVLRSLGTRFIITDKILNDKDVSLVMVENQQLTKPNDGYIDYNVSTSAGKIFENLINKYSHGTVARADFIREFNDKLAEIYPAMQQDREKTINFLYSAINSALAEKSDVLIWSQMDLKKIKRYYDIVLFMWMGSPPLYLYEIRNPNLASFSPTKVIQINSADKLFSQMSKPDFSFEQSIIIQNKLPANIVSHLLMANNTQMRYERNAVQVKAESKGWSILLLPLQYSHCFRISNMTASSNDREPVRLIRANLVNGALLFNGNIDVKLKFAFGIGKNVNCRKKDIQDMRNLGLIVG